MTQTEEEWQYKDRPGSWSKDLDRIRAELSDRSDKSKEDTCLLPIANICSQSAKLVIMGKAKVIVKRSHGDMTYRVTFHETWTRLE